MNTLTTTQLLALAGKGNVLAQRELARRETERNSKSIL